MQQQTRRPGAELYLEVFCFKCVHRIMSDSWHGLCFDVWTYICFVIGV